MKWEWNKLRRYKAKKTKIIKNEGNLQDVQGRTELIAYLIRDNEESQGRKTESKEVKMKKTKN